jgi:predicted alpha/beta superfamily hydrolase
MPSIRPLVDHQYRTLPGRAHTAIMGSSMGGLASHYAIARYPQVFGKAGVFSPACWTAAPSFDFMAQHPLPKDAPVPAGARQARRSDGAGAQRMAGVVRASGHPEAGSALKIVPGAGHNEGFWSGELREALLWMFAR